MNSGDDGLDDSPRSDSMTRGVTAPGDLCSNFDEGLSPAQLFAKSHNLLVATRFRWPRGATRFYGERKPCESKRRRLVPWWIAIGMEWKMIDDGEKHCARQRWEGQRLS